MRVPKFHHFNEHLVEAYIMLRPEVLGIRIPVTAQLYFTHIRDLILQYQTVYYQRKPRE